jgi:hypothetical protein
MPSPSLLQIVGSRGDKQPKYAPIFTDRFFVGLWTNRNPLRSPLSTFYADGWHLGGTDALIGGVNIELSPRLTLCRRPGNNAYSTATVPLPPLTFYPFRLFGATSPAIDVIVDTATNVYTLTPTTLTSIFTKGMGAGQSNFLGIGQTLYFGDGVEVEAWQNGTIRNWGISIGPFSNSVGPTIAGAGADGGGPNVWTNPNNATSTSVFATVTAGLGDPSNNLNATTFGFSIPVTTIITGIAISFKAAEPAGTVPHPFIIAQLLKNGTVVGTTKSVPLTTTATVYTIGSVSDTWGASFTGNDVSQATWGVALYAGGAPLGAGNGSFELNSVKATIYGTGGPTVSTTTGTLSPTVGYEYVVAYGNSTSGQVSSATPPSALIKPVAQGVLVDLIASTDPQVNQIWVFRTTDGGDTFLNLPTSPYPNTTQNVTDTAPDSELNILQQAPIDLANNPPPAGSLDPVLYLGLVWVHVGNAVYFSRTPSALVGISAESFPPANVFTFPETVIRKVPINNGLLIFTTSNIYEILGNNTSTSILYDAPFLAGYGVISWNAVFIDGSIIYFFTADHRLVSLDPSSGVTDMGFPIGDQLASFNPASVYVAYHSSTSNDVALYLGDGSTGWFRCNPNQAPDGQITGPVWSPKANIVGGCGAIAAMETSPGFHQLMIGATGDNLPVLVRDSTYTTFTDNGTAYEANYQIGSIVLAQPGQAAIMRFVTAEFIRTGTSPTVSVLLGEISGTFESISGYVVNDPPYLVASTSLFNNRYYFKQTVGGNPPSPTICRHLQIGVDYGTNSVQNELLSMTINGAHYSEK